MAFKPPSGTYAPPNVIRTSGDEWVKVRDVATRLKLQPKTVREWIVAGKLPCRVLKVDRTWRVYAPDIDRFLDNSPID